MRRRLPVLLILVLAWAPGVAVGQQPTPPTPDLGAEAGLHFDLGVRAYSAGRYEEALEHLLLSNRLAPNRKVVFNIARAYEGLGQLTAAWSAYADFAAAEPDPQMRAPAETAMEKLASEVALVRVHSDPEGASIYVGRRDLGLRGSTPRTLALAPGDHTIVVEAWGHQPIEQRVVAEVGRTVPVDLGLEPLKVDFRVQGAPASAQVGVVGQGEVLGRVEDDLQLPVGDWEIEIAAPGYTSRRVALSLTPGQPALVAGELARATGTVVVGGPVKGARIDVDGEAVGFLPAVIELPVGVHMVRVEAADYRVVQFAVDVHDGEVTEVQPKLVPETRVVAASRAEESLLEAPNTVVVVDRGDIRSRGYTDLAEVVADLPGFDVIVANGVTYLLAYQRGYRTPQTQRTLLLTDGREDNLMWSQSSELSRQFPMTDVDRVEVLYGPASAVYGPNAFLGVINVVTWDPLELEPGEQEATVQLGGGSFQTGWVDTSVRGRVGGVGYSLAARGFVSEEDDLSGRWGFVSNEQLSDPLIWGPLLDRGDDLGPYELQGEALGHYADPTEDWGVRGRLLLGGLELGWSHWTVSEGYGPYYASDRAQASPRWNTSAQRVWAQWSADIGSRLHSRTLVQRKRDRIWGSWAEASPDGEYYSFVSLTQWNAPSALWEAREQLTWEVSDAVQVTGGTRWVRKDLTREYDVPGYWDAFSSQAVPPEGGIGHSADPSYTPPPGPLAEMPARNRVTTDDLGGYGQLRADLGDFRLHGGLRADWNSTFGTHLSPRAGLIWRYGDEAGAVKLLYGHALQEPSARQLWGEWDGRGANPDLVPETVDSLELVWMLRTPELLLESSVYGAHYENVIQEEAENQGERDIAGFEARASADLPNPLRTTRPVDTWANYTLTTTRSSVSWAAADRWVQRPSPIGDIAPHKVNAGVSWPLTAWLGAHTRANLVSARLPYGSNPLRAQGERFAPYGLVDAMVDLSGERWDLALQIDNLFDAEVLQPGAESANAGTDFSSRSLGYLNSALPLPGRSFQLVLTLDGRHTPAASAR